MPDDQNESASYQPSNEPTKEQKEFAFKIFLRDGWNNGLFTAVGPDEPKDCYANGRHYLDLLSSNEVAIVAESYGYGVEGYFGIRSEKDEITEKEMMMLDFILLDLADELGYELIELQNEAHWLCYLQYKDELEAGGWIPYDGSGMPEGLEEKQVQIFCFGSNTLEFSLEPFYLKGKRWSWHAAIDNESAGIIRASIAFYKVNEATASFAEENDNV